jgi:hypothetical protein
MAKKDNKGRNNINKKDHQLKTEAVTSSTVSYNSEDKNNKQK